MLNRRSSLVAGPCLVFGLACCTANAAGLILNEANCVGSQKWLGNPGSASGACPQPEGPGGINCANNDDMHFGRVMGNGGDWIELVVTADHLDIRNWKLRWAETDLAGGSVIHANGTDLWYGNGGIEQGIITFSYSAAWSDLRAGTILTITEKTTAQGGLNTDLSFDPCAGDWSINANSFDTRYITTVINVLDEDAVPPYSQLEPLGSFGVGNDNWQVTILDASNNIVIGPIGEEGQSNPGIGWQGSGINSREIIRLAENPSAAINSFGLYEDSDQSSCGHPNRWTEDISPGVTCDRTQDFRSLRSWVNCPCARIALNEYNAVGETLYLNGGTAGADINGGQAADNLFGRALGNGGDWFELMVTDDHVDLRGATLNWEEVANQESGTITLTTHPLWSNLRAGTIVTFIRNNSAGGGLDTNVSYNASLGDRWINIWTKDTAYIASSTSTVGSHSYGDFHTSNDNWRLNVRNAANVLLSMSSGEGSSGYSGRGVANTETCDLQQDPTNNVKTWDFYNANVRSTFGSLNQWKPCPGAAILTQSIASLLANTCTRAADTNASGVVNVDDLLNVINSWGICPELPCLGDVNNNGVVNVDDLLGVINGWG